MEGGVEVHLTLHPVEGGPRRFAAVFVAPPALDEVIELAEEEERTYRVTEVRRSLRGLLELKPDAEGSLNAAYERLAKRGVPYADEIVFVLAEEELEPTETD